MSRRTEQLIAKSMPDMEVVKRSSQYAQDSTAKRALKPGASIADLKRKYLGTTDTNKGFAADSMGRKLEPIDEDVEVLVVQRKTSGAKGVDMEKGKRTIVTSRNRGIIGSQG